MSKTLRDVGECEVIRRLSQRLPFAKNVKVGIGDDAAVVSQGETGFDLLLTSDALIEGIHFESTAEAERVGHKALARTLSDLAAMGGEPLWALVDVSAPPNMELERLTRIYDGLAATASAYGLSVVGGDTSTSAEFSLHVFAVGRVPVDTSVLRSGAQVGDCIYVTGALGGSLAEKHLTFKPCIREGQWLREGGWVTAMMDVSDGLATDFHHVAQASSVGLRVELDAVPVSAQLKGVPDALDRALSDGEDFELLFTVREEKRLSFEKAWGQAFELSCTCIGRVVEDGQHRVVYLDADGLSSNRPVGYEHYTD